MCSIVFAHQCKVLQGVFAQQGDTTPCTFFIGAGYTCMPYITPQLCLIRQHSTVLPSLSCRLLLTPLGICASPSLRSHLASSGKWADAPRAASAPTHTVDSQQANSLLASSMSGVSVDMVMNVGLVMSLLVSSHVLIWSCITSVSEVMGFVTSATKIWSQRWQRR